MIYLLHMLCTAAGAEAQLRVLGYKAQPKQAPRPHTPNPNHAQTRHNPKPYVPNPKPQAANAAELQVAAQTRAERCGGKTSLVLVLAESPDMTAACKTAGVAAAPASLLLQVLPRPKTPNPKSQTLLPVLLSHAAWRQTRWHASCWLLCLLLALPSYGRPSGLDLQP
jgi:hypothetical protein